MTNGFSGVAIVIGVAIGTSFVARARAQGDESGEERCTRAHELLDRGESAAARRLLAQYGNDDLGGEDRARAGLAACVLAGWGRLARAAGEPIRAAVFLERALRAAAIASPVAPPVASTGSIERLRAALPGRARALGDVVIAIDAEEPAQLPGVRTPLELCELVRAIEELGYWDLGAVRCEVARRARGAGVEAAALHVVASRTLSVEELVVGVRGPDGWHVVARDLGVDVGHGMAGALRVTGCAIRRGPDGEPEVVTTVRRWQAELAPERTAPTRRWDAREHVCARRGDAWACGASRPTGP